MIENLQTGYSIQEFYQVTLSIQSSASVVHKAFPRGTSAVPERVPMTMAKVACHNHCHPQSAWCLQNYIIDSWRRLTGATRHGTESQNGTRHTDLDCGSNISWVISLQYIHNRHPMGCLQLTLGSCVFFKFKVWALFYLSHCSAICNIVSYLI